MGIGKDGFYTTKEIAKIDAEYNIIISGRGVGKSYAISAEKNKDNKYYTGYLHRAWKEKKCILGYVRRFESDVKSTLVEDDFSDKNIKKITSNRYDHVKCFRGKMYFAKTKEDGNEERAKWAFGQIFALNIAGRYKSRQYPEITDIVYEESVACDNERYLANETRILENLVSTIFRDRKGRVWMLGNTVSRHSPYFKEWGLRGVSKMKVGQIDTYEKKNDDGSVIKIALEYSPNRNSENRMFFGKTLKSITGSDWQTDEFRHITGKVSDYDLLDEIQIVGDMFKFNLKLLMTLDANMFIYIYPNTRLYDDVYTVTPKGGIGDIHKRLSTKIRTHDIIRKCWRDGAVCFSDNLCGQDFHDFLKNEDRGILS